MSEELDQVQPEDESRPEEGQELENGGEQQEGQEAAQPSQDEERARRLGWVPQSEFRGDPAKWVSAEEFNRRGEEQLPLLRANLRRTEQELTELKETTRKFAEFHQKVEEQSYQRALEALKQQRIEARQNFDVAREMEIEDEIAELKQKGPPRVEEPAKPEQRLDPDYVSWMSENQWAKDPEAYALGIAIGERLRKQGDQSIGRPYLDRIKQEMRKEHPRFFPELENENRQQRQAVGQSTALLKKSGKTFNDLPADAKAACLDFEKKGLIKREQYIKEYFQE